MPINPALTLAQWFSPGFPVGSFAYSHGLETVIDDGRLASADDLRDWCEALLTLGTGRNDAILICAAYTASADGLDELDQLARAFCSSSGRLTETEEQGAAFARTLSGMGLGLIKPYAYPVAVGAAARAHGIPLDMTVQFYLQAFVANLVSAAVRRVPLGQTEGQQVLAGLQDLVGDVADQAQTLGPDDLMSSTFAADIAAMQHETLYSRSFRT